MPFIEVKTIRGVFSTEKKSHQRGYGMSKCRFRIGRLTESDQSRWPRTSWAVWQPRCRHAIADNLPAVAVLVHKNNLGGVVA